MTTSGMALSAGLSSPLLDGLLPRDLHSILAVATQRDFLASTVVVNQGDPANTLFLLTRGRARYFFLTPEGPRLLLRWPVPCDCFRVITLFPHPSLYPLC